jgi:hypothetical protein
MKKQKMIVSLEVKESSERLAALAEIYRRNFALIFDLTRVVFKVESDIKDFPDKMLCSRLDFVTFGDILNSDDVTKFQSLVAKMKFLKAEESIRVEISIKLETVPTLQKKEEDILKALRLKKIGEVT